MGGRGSSSGGESLSSGGGKFIAIMNSQDVWSYRHNPDNEAYVDAINSSVRDIADDFPDIMSSTVARVDTADFGGDDRTSTLGCYGGGTLTMNKLYTDIDKMNRVYDNASKRGFHPSRGNKNGTEAVTYHEMGHAITDHIAVKLGEKDMDGASKRIVNDAYKASKGTGGTKAWAGNISGYAQENFAECVAEAVSDFYCNGNKAKSQSKAIVRELKKYS